MIDKETLLLTRMADLIEVAELEDDWDQFGAIAPSASAVAQAAQFIVSYAVNQDSLSRSGIPTRVYALANGAVQLEWQYGVVSIEVEIAGTDEFAFLLDDEGAGICQYYEEHGVTEERVRAAIMAVLTASTDDFVGGWEAA